MRFGLVPSFTDPGAKVDFYRMFNARSETIAEKGVFSRLLQRRRGVVLINGFYEWAAERAGSSQVKQPYYLHLEGKGGGSEGDVLRCAALYDRWKGAAGGELVTVTIITVEASEPLRWLHDRMPAVLRTDADVAVWLEGSDDRPSSALRPYGEADMKWYPVTTRINRGDFEDPSCCERTRRAATFVRSPRSPRLRTTSGASTLPRTFDESLVRSCDRKSPAGYPRAEPGWRSFYSPARCFERRRGRLLRRWRSGCSGRRRGRRWRVPTGGT